MARLFALTIHLHDHRFHGADEWPPAPARVFQALLAGVARGRQVPDDAARALVLLEGLSPPIIAAPSARRGRRVSMYVPNNDLDAVGGDLGRVDEVRTKKTVRPFLFEGPPKFLYAWELPDERGEELLQLADGLYQLGRGIDPGWALGEVIDDVDLATRLRSHRGTVHRPSPGDGSTELAVPTTNTFLSLVRRYEGNLARLRSSSDGRTDFVQAPKANFATVQYDGTPRFHLFELQCEAEPTRATPWTASRAASLIERVRDVAVDALSRALPEKVAAIERVLVGRKRDGADAGPIEQRIRLIPLPSIGHPHADQAIRRLLVQVPQGPLDERDILWALSGRTLFEPETGELSDTTLAAARSDEMVQRYCGSSQVWRSVTPLALGVAPRRRIEPTRQRDEAKSAAEREREERAARKGVAQALRHAGVNASVVRVHVQREPFDAHGTRAEHFACGTRFRKEVLWHVELGLDRAIQGPLVLGDGRFLGLGVMAPQPRSPIFAVNVERGVPAVAPTMLARALRRAVMARVQAVVGARREYELDPFFHGHSPDGSPLRTEESSHLAWSVDHEGSRLLIVPPHSLESRLPSRREVAHLELLERALADFSTLRAGRGGVLTVAAAPLSDTDRLCLASRVFRSITDYVVCRHAKRLSPDEAVACDVRRECARQHLPAPVAVRVEAVRGVAGQGVFARIQLTFRVALRGPLLLGKNRFLGGGLFEPVLRENRG